MATSFEVRVRTQSLCGYKEEDGEEDNSPEGEEKLPTDRQVVQLWTTKEAGACIITALLLKIDSIGPTGC